MLPDQLDARGDIPHWSLPPTCSVQLVALMQLQEVVGLQHLVAELRVEMPALMRVLTDSRAIIAPRLKCLPISRRKAISSSFESHV